MKQRGLVVLLGGLVVALLTAPVVGAQGLPDRRSVLEEERARFGATLSAAEAGTLLARVAWRLRGEGFGLLRKDAGNRCPIPASDVTVSCDWLVHRPSGLGCDVLVSGPDATTGERGPSTPTWCLGEPFDASRFVAPVDPGGGVVTPPVEPEPPETPEEGPTIIQRLEAIQTQLAALTAKVEALAVLPSTAPWPVYVGRIPFLGSVTLTPQERK